MKRTIVMLIAVMLITSGSHGEGWKEGEKVLFDQREKVISACVSGIKGQGFSEKQARDYCVCSIDYFTEIVRKYSKEQLKKIAKERGDNNFIRTDSQQKCEHYLGVNGVSAQNKWVTFRDNNLKFRFLYPSDWVQGTPRGENVKVSLFAPKGSPRDNCNIVVRPFSEFAGLTQKQLNEEVGRGGPFSAADWKAMLGGKWPDLKVVKSKIAKVDNQPAYFGVVEIFHETLDRKTYMKNMVLMTFTPGYMWQFTCTAKGTTIEEARISFDHRQSTFQRIIGSLVFERW